MLKLPSVLWSWTVRATKFTKIREIRINTNNNEWCYIPHPHNMMVTSWEPLQKGGEILTKSRDKPNETMWRMRDMEVDGKIISPQSIVYSNRHDALLVVDVKNRTVWALDPGTGEVLQNIDVPELDQNDFLELGFLKHVTIKHDYPTKVFLTGQPVCHCLWL